MTTEKKSGEPREFWLDLNTDENAIEDERPSDKMLHYYIHVREVIEENEPSSLRTQLHENSIALVNALIDVDQLKEERDELVSLALELVKGLNECKDEWSGEGAEELLEKHKKLIQQLKGEA